MDVLRYWADVFQVVVLAPMTARILLHLVTTNFLLFRYWADEFHLLIFYFLPSPPVLRLF